MRILIGSTGFVGSNLAAERTYDVVVRRADLERAAGLAPDELVIAGLPGTKWLANQEPGADLRNMLDLERVVRTIAPRRATLISTVDVYDRPHGVSEATPPDFSQAAAYGRHRAWFEAFFHVLFPTGLVVRLPALFGPGLKKNLAFDLLHRRYDQLAGMNGDSRFQFLDVRRVPGLVEQAHRAGLVVANLVPEPVSASEVAACFGTVLGRSAPAVSYDVRTDTPLGVTVPAGYVHDAATSLDDLRSWIGEEGQHS